MTTLNQFALCDHCRQLLHRDGEGFWVGEDKTPECVYSMWGHEVDGEPR